MGQPVPVTVSNRGAVIAAMNGREIGIEATVPVSFAASGFPLQITGILR